MSDPRAMARRGLLLNTELAARALESFILDAVETTGTAGVVVGLSGGLDSALSTTLAVRALGAGRVHAFILPYRTSSPESAADARAVAKAAGLEAGEIAISALVDPYFEALEPEAGSGGQGRAAAEAQALKVRRGNFMARARMAILFDQAKKTGCLVLGTSNKTEILLGYTTIFGDNASSINPLGDLYKCQVRALAHHVGVPEQVVDKAPSADLWPGQTDEDELGFTYDLADEILYLVFNRGLSPAEVVELGYPAQVVAEIERLERANRFKRRLMLIARLSGSAINLDREIPRD